RSGVSEKQKLTERGNGAGSFRNADIWSGTWKDCEANLKISAVRRRRRSGQDPGERRKNLRKRPGLFRKKDSAGRQCRREDFWQPEPAVWQPERWGLCGLSF